MFGTEVDLKDLYFFMNKIKRRANGQRSGIIFSTGTVIGILEVASLFWRMVHLPLVVVGKNVPLGLFTTISVPFFRDRNSTPCSRR